MLNESLHILILEDNPADARLVQLELSEAGLTFIAKVVMTEQDYVRELTESCPDLILSDYNLSKYNGSLALAEAKRRCPDTPFILVTGAIGEDRAIEILTQGAKDYVLKSWLQQRLVPAVWRVLAEAEEHQARKKAEAELQEANRTLEQKVKARTAELQAEIEVRKQVEEELRYERDRVRGYLDTVQTIIVALNSEGRITAINKKGCQILGCSEDELIGQLWFSSCLPQPDGMENVYPVFLKLIAGKMKAAEYFENTIVTQSGELRQIAWYNTLLRDEQGRIIGTLSSGEDITKRKHLESQKEAALEALKKNEEMLRLITENMSDMIRVTDLQGTNLYVSPSHVKCLGYKPEERLGKNGFDIIHPDDAEKIFNKFMEGITGKIPMIVQYRVKHADGHYLWLETVADLLRDAAGKETAVVMCSRDITERKQAEEAVKESGNYLNQIINRIGDPLFVKDQQLRFVLVNEALCTFLGKTRKELIGTTGYEYLPKEEMAVFEKQDKIVFETGEESINEENLTDGKGKIHTIVTKKTLYTDDGVNKQLVGVIRDITERKQAEEQMKESWRRLTTIIDFLPDATMVIDREGKVTAWNRAMEIMTGVKAEEMLGKGNYEYAYPFYGERRPILIDFAMHPEAEREKQYTTIQRSGDIIFGEAYTPKLALGNIHLSATASILRNVRGEIVAAIECIRNNTDRKQAEKKLQETTERLHLATVSAKAGVWDWNLQTGEMIWDDRMLELYGLTQENFPGGVEACEQGLHPDDSARAIEECQAALRGEREFDTEFRVRRRDGTVIHIKANGLVHRDEEGKPLRMTGLNTDITDRKNAEHALRDSKAQLELAMLSADIGMWYWDIIDKKRYFDKQVCHMLGIDQATFRGTEEEFLRRVHPDDVETIKAALSRTIEQNAIYKVEYRVIWLDKSVHYIRARGMLARDQKGRPAKINGIIWDITSHKQAEEEKRILEERLQRAEKMEALGLLAGGVAHDLNNVLGIVVGYSEMILNDIDETNPLREDILNVMEGGQRAAAIVQDLLTLARRGVSGRKVLNLNRLILDFEKAPEWDKLLSYHPTVQIKIDLEPDLLNISGSSVHLDKTLFNLVSNASEAMPKGGTLTIKTANHYLDKPLRGYDEIREGDYVVLSISDTGEGISVSDLQRIFEPFYTKKIMGRSGTGLGLSVVWGTVKDHQGYINVESEDGKGSTFTLYFPVTREDIKTEASSVSMSEYTGKGESILVVDDVKGQRDLATAMLKKLNYKVENVGSGEEAVEYLKKHKVDLLVLDMIMDPGIDGLDTYKSVLTIHPKQKAIIVSGFSESDRVNAAHELGAGAYVKKPYVIEKLGMAAKKELQGKKVEG